MKKILAALALLSSSAFGQNEVAASVYEAPTEEVEIEFVPSGVITSIVATPANGGINPAYAGVKLKGTIRAGGNSCDAQRYEVGLTRSESSGKIVFTPFVKEKEVPPNLMCIALYDVDFAGLAFEQTFVVPAKKLKKAVVENVGSEGKTVKLSTLYAKPAPVVVDPCTEIRSFCNKMLNPSNCSIEANDQLIEVRGNNSCEATAALETQLCDAGIKYKKENIVCESELGF